MDHSVELLLLGDVCPAEGVRHLFDLGDPSDIFGGLIAGLQRADVGLCNLECVLSDSASGIEKIGPVLIGNPSDAKVLADAGINLVGLANNHIGDCGAKGVLDTLAACHISDISTFGAGPNSAEAEKPALVDVKGIKVGFLAFAEVEFNAATEQSPGAHTFDPLQDLERISVLKSQCDFVVILYHGGIEHYPYPSPRLRKACRAMVRHGADLVLCQHSHVIGAAEEYWGGNILYGQGNSAYGHRAGSTDWNQGLAVSVVLTRKDSACAQTRVSHKVQYLPIGCDASGRVDLLTGDVGQRCMDEFKARSMKCSDEAWLAESWETFARRLGASHLPHVLGFGRVATKFNRLSRGLLVNLLYTKRQRLVSMNVIRCDAHREVLETAFAKSVSLK